MGFSKEQPLAVWSSMLHEVFWRSQNYAKTSYELHSHLSEIVGLIGKNMLRKNSPESATHFLAKVFGWAIALVHRVEGEKAPIEDFILRKFPECCPYCLDSPCTCHTEEERPPVKQEEITDRFHRLDKRSRSVNDFQDMFRAIYSESWETLQQNGDLGKMRSFIFARLVEELAELHEAIRFHHLYESNFRNEFADFMAWWFALVSTMHLPAQQSTMLLSAQVLWDEYPGYCKHCNSIPCRCRPRPIRELMSKPSPSQLALIDELTGLYNYRAFEADTTAIAGGNMPISIPCACAIIDVDDLKGINKAHGLSAGSEAIKHVGMVLRKKLRDEDRLYRRNEGDEFCVICPDFSAEEAKGMLRRVLQELSISKPVWSGYEQKFVEIPVTACVGIAECMDLRHIKEAFERADAAYSESNKRGRSQIEVSA